MRCKSLIYYGYEKEVYLSVADQRRKTNLRNTMTLAVLFCLAMIVVSIMCAVNVLPYAHRSLYMNYSALGILFLLAVIILNRYPDLAERTSTFLMYLFAIMAISFAIQSSLVDSFQMATAFHALILLIDVVFIDNMISATIYTVGSAAVLIATSFANKPPSVARNDLFYALTFMVLALFFHFFFQRNRIAQFLSYYRNLMISRDLEVHSSFDALSTLLARGRFFSLADNMVHSSELRGYNAVCILDLDAFKQINDKLGHQMGDKAIQIAGETIWKVLDIDVSRKWDFCERAVEKGWSYAGRLGGDEFVIFLRGENSWEDAEKKLRSILDTLNAVRMGELQGIQASFGVTEIREDDRDFDTVYERADEALYIAKQSGKNRIVKK